MEVREVHSPNDGRDPFPVLIGRGRIPIDRSSVPGKLYNLLIIRNCSNIISSCPSINCRNVTTDSIAINTFNISRYRVLQINHFEM